MDSDVKYLLSLSAIRERAKIVSDAAQAGKLNHFNLHEERMDAVADFVTAVIQVISPNIQAMIEHRRTNSYHSVTLGRTNTIQFLLMAAGNISK